MPEIDLAGFAPAHAAGATVIDVREPSEYAAGHLPGAYLLPAGQLPERIDDLRCLAPVYVVCASGVRSSRAAAALVDAGVVAYSVAGGTNAWQAQGRPVVRGRQRPGLFPAPQAR